LEPNNGITAVFAVPKELLRDGVNQIAVEVHQCNASSTDLFFDLSLFYAEDTSAEPEILGNPVYTGVLNNNFSLKAVYEIDDENPDEETVFINEIVAQNTLFPDENGAFGDYIELYNSGEEAVNIADWYLSDTPANPTLARIPASDLAATMIPAKGRIVVWADGLSHTGVLHVGFKLSADGETVTLSRDDGYGGLVVVDRVTYPALTVNMSYSRLPDGGPYWVVQPPTFNAPNEGSSTIDAETNSLVRLYPTVVDNCFAIENAKGVLVKVTDVSGTRVIEQKCVSDRETFPSAQLPKGIYIVSVGCEQFKIIKR
jgi:hypothetical protein